MCSCSGSNKVRNSRFRKFIYQQWPILLYIIISYRENEQFCLGCSLETKMTFQNGIVYDLISVEYYDGSHLTAALKYENNWYDYDGMKIPTIRQRLSPLNYFDGKHQVCGLYYQQVNII